MNKVYCFINIVALFFFSLTGFAQNTMNIYQGNGTTISLPTISIDSVRFSSNGPSSNQVIYQNNFNILSISIQNIDSINYTTPNPASLPIVSSTGPFNITSSSIAVGGNVTSDGGSPVIARGVCWSTVPSPSIANNYTNDGTGLGQYFSQISPLQSSTTYYVRAYATNQYGTSYGNNIVVNTSIGSGGLATVITNSNITSTGFNASTGGDVINDGGSAVVSRGVCWAIGTTPTINNAFTVDGAGAGTFSSTPTNLLPNTTYFVRAYATNSAGTAYGNTYSFTTLSVGHVSTQPPSNVSYFSMTLNATLLSSGGNPILGLGFCIDTLSNPNLSSSVLLNSTQTSVGPFSKTFSQFLNNETYYIRSYATTIAGTVYGNIIVVNTLPSIPQVQTDTVNYFSGIDANVTGSVISDGGDSVISRGTCWSTNPFPTFNSTYTVDGSGLGVFQSNLTGLAPSTIYYYRAYATNSSGTAYGNNNTFTTCSAPQFSSTNIISYYSNSANLSASISANGGCSVVSYGFCWGLNSTPTISGSNVFVNGNILGSFNMILPNLSSNTLYHARPFAINSVDTTYGAAVSFTTLYCDNGLCEGDFYQGGIIAYIYRPGDPGYSSSAAHGLISANSDLGSFSWGCYGTVINGTSGAIGSGQNNTNLITTNCPGSTTAAYQCSNLSSNGYNDWWLPSTGELSMLYYNIHKTGLSIMNGIYWASNQCSANGAYFTNFNHPNGGIYTYCVPGNGTPNKGSSLSVRPIRYF